MVNRLGLSNTQPLSTNSLAVKNASKQSVGFGNGDNPAVEKIAEFSKQTKENVLEPAAAGLGIAVAAGVGGKAGGVLVNKLQPEIKALAKGISEMVVPFVKKYADKTENFIGKGLKKLPNLVTIAKGNDAATTLAGKLETVFNAPLKVLSALAAGVYAGENSSRVGNAFNRLVDPTAVSDAIGS